MQQTERVKLSQWDALLLESLRSRGYADEELLQRVKSGDLPADDSEYEFDYTRLTELSAEEPGLLEQALRGGYQIKYNTIRGIFSWIKVALGRQAELKLEEGREAVEATLTAAERSRLEAVLSHGWKLLTPDNGPGAAKTDAVFCRIEPLRG